MPQLTSASLARCVGMLPILAGHAFDSMYMVAFMTFEPWPWPSRSTFALKADRPHPRNYSTHRHIPSADYVSSLPLVALGKAEPLISTAGRQKFDLDLFDLDLFDLDPWPLTLTHNLDPYLWPWPWPWTQSKVTVMSKHNFWHLTLTFDLRPWPTIPT